VVCDAAPFAPLNGWVGVGDESVMGSCRCIGGSRCAPIGTSADVEGKRGLYESDGGVCVSHGVMLDMEAEDLDVCRGAVGGTELGEIS
jgi:hypothetical protein